MAFLSLMEIVHAVAMSAVVGWIFMDAFNTRKFRTPEDYMAMAKSTVSKTFAGRFDWDSFWFAVMLVAPSIILHEFGHKFVAMAFGLEATFHAAWLWLGIGVLLKLMGGFLFFVPAFVSISGPATTLGWVFGLTALAGPAVNFALYGLAKLIPWYKTSQLKKHLRKKEVVFWVLLAKINLFLGAFNLIPLGFFDGGQALRAFFGMG